jgi:phosphopantetheinyl transferase (holo-ACP synthase)
MADDIEIKINLEAPHGLFLRKNEKGIDGTLLKSLEDLKATYKNAPWVGLLDPPKTENQERLVEFAESRRCLLAAINKINLSDMSSKNQETHISISHTKTHSAAFAVLDDGETLAGVGIDIESKDRTIKPEVRAKFVFEFEERLNLTPLELWTIKESSFKAHSNAKEDGANPGTLFQFEIDEYDPERREGKSIKVQSESESEDESPGDSTSFQILSHGDLIITIAMTER